MKTNSVLLAAVVTVLLAGCNCGDGGSDGGMGGGAGGGSSGGQFALSSAPSTVSIGQGGLANLAVHADRGAGEAGAITFTVVSPPAGVTASFDPAMAAAGSDLTTLTLNVATTAALGAVMIQVKGTGPTGSQTLMLPLTITAPVQVLLVDDDYSDNNNGGTNPTASANDSLFNNLLTGASTPYNTFVVANGANGPTFDQLKSYSTVIWYCGSAYGSTGNVGTVSGADEVNLKAFLDLANKKVVIFCDSYFYAADGTATWTSTANAFASGYLGEQGFAWDKLNNVGYTAAGVGPMAGVDLNVAKDTPDTTYTDPMNPAAGTDVFFTTLLDPDGNGMVAAPISTGRKNVGTAGSSKAIVFGFPFENVVDIATNSKAAAFAKVLAY